MLYFIKFIILTPRGSSLHLGGDTADLTLDVRVYNEYNGCWGPGSLRHQNISTRDIEYVE